MSQRIPAEEAFQFYAAQGTSRSHQAVADRFSCSKRAVTKLAVREGWTKRLKGIEDSVRNRTDAKIAETMEEVRDRHLMTIRAMHARALTALKQYPITSGMDAIRAAELTVKLERLVLGEASERTELSVEEITKRELERWLVREPAKNGDDEHGQQAD